MSTPKTTLQATFPKTTHIFSPPHTSLDLYLPLSQSPPHKTYVHFHGGGLVRGTRDFHLPDQILNTLLQNSWAVVSADYSLLPQGTAADILADLLALETWLLDNPEIDVNHLAVGGRSAGGYVASLAAGNWTKFRPKAVLDLFGMVDLAGEYWAQKKSVAPVLHGCETEGLKEEQFAELLRSEEVKSFAEIVIGLGGERSWFFLWSIKEGNFLDFLLGRHESQRGRNTVPEGEEWKYLPVQLVERGGFPPTFVVHGDADDLVLIKDSEVFVEALKRKGVEVEFRIIVGGGHGTFPLDQQEVVYAEAAEFVMNTVG